MANAWSESSPTWRQSASLITQAPNHTHKKQRQSLQKTGTQGKAAQTQGLRQKEYGTEEYALKEEDKDHSKKPK